MAYTHVGTKYIKRQQDFDNFLKFRHTLVQVLQHFCSVNIFECMECGRTEDQLGSVEEPPLSWPV